MGLTYSDYKHPEITPNFRESATFDPLTGFQNGREERKMQVTQEQMEKAQLDETQRDYCAHLIIDFKKCKKENFPFIRRHCEPIYNHWTHCQYDDYVLRMKEYEREKRLMMRAQRKKQQQQELSSEQLVG